MNHTYDQLANAAVLGRAYIGQRFESSASSIPLGGIYLYPYGRFGNNFYQIANASLIAMRMEAPFVALQNFSTIREMDYDEELRFSITTEAAEIKSENSISGSLYAPYGFEKVFQSYTDLEIERILRKMNAQIYRELLSEVFESNGMVLHFRGGDIFSLEEKVHPWYVQPPASYYVKCIENEFAKGKFSSVRLIWEDRANPTLAKVEQYLNQSNIDFLSQQQSLKDDLCSILSAKSVISSYGSFCEAAAIISPHLRSYYSFRTHTSQGDFYPFVQASVLSILKLRQVRCYIVDDMTHTYILPKTWSNSETQRAAMLSFHIDNLRCYNSE